MGGRKVITMCHFMRPGYSRRVLRALAECEGIGDYLILPHVEPGHEEVRALVEAIDFAECIPTFNAQRFGVDLNTELALSDGFRHGDFVIHIEDDIVCAADALRFYEWCAGRYADDPRVFSVTGYNRRQEPADAGEWHVVRLRKWFHPWGWATWKDRWQQFRGRLHEAREGWDVYLNNRFCTGGRTPRCHEAYPELSRSQNIGLASSLFDTFPGVYREDHTLAHWAGNHEVPAGAFRE